MDSTKKSGKTGGRSKKVVLEGVDVDAFLETEEKSRSEAGAKFTPARVKAFRDVVRRFAERWLRDGAGRRLSLVSAREEVGLHFETLHGTRWVSVFSLRSHLGDKEFVLKGPNPERDSLPLSASFRRSLDTLHKTWKAFPAATGSHALYVVARLQEVDPPAGIDKYLESALGVAVTPAPRTARGVGEMR